MDAETEITENILKQMMEKSLISFFIVKILKANYILLGKGQGALLVSGIKI